MSRQHRGAMILAYITLAVVIGVGVGMLVLIPSTLTSKDNTSAVLRGNDLTTCRSEANGLVQEKQDAVDAAVRVVADTDDQLEDVRALREDLVLQGLAATATGNSAALEQLAASTPMVLTALQDARTAKDEARRVEDAARAAKSVALKDYLAAVERSRRDPEQFIAECKESDG